jgi:ATP-dependent RNA helicase RhlE
MAYYTSLLEVDVTPVSSTAEKVNQSVFFVEKKEKIKLLTSILKAEA